MGNKKTVENTPIEDLLCPERDKLISDSDGNLSAVVLDEELDSLECSFNYDNSVQINTEGFDYICLGVETLYKLIELIEESEEIYSNQVD